MCPVEKEEKNQKRKPGCNQRGYSSRGDACREFSRGTQRQDRKQLCHYFNDIQTVAGMLGLHVAGKIGEAPSEGEKSLDFALTCEGWIESLGRCVRLPKLILATCFYSDTISLLCNNKASFLPLHILLTSLCWWCFFLIELKWCLSPQQVLYQRWLDLKAGFCELE